MDKVCKLFSEKFYRNLLEGKTIKESFEQARRIVQVSKEDFETCCCAHKHEPFCSWFKFSQTDTLKAHEIHSKPCKCYQYGVNGRR
jgi:heme oxygenase